MPASFSWQDFIVNLFARKAFTANLLERSFRQPMGWVELAIMLALAFVAYRLSEKWAQSSKIKAIRFRMIRHVLRRVLFPVLLLVVALIAQVAWEAAGFHAVWLKLLLLAANWMMAIRLVLALINGAFPKARARMRLNARRPQGFGAVLFCGCRALMTGLLIGSNRCKSPSAQAN